MARHGADNPPGDDRGGATKQGGKGRGGGEFFIHGGRCLYHSTGHIREWGISVNRRVAVTGMAGISPIGNDWPSIRARLGSYRNAITKMEEWSGYDGLNTQLGAPAADFTLSERYTTKATRSKRPGCVP